MIEAMELEGGENTHLNLITEIVGADGRPTAIGTEVQQTVAEVVDTDVVMIESEKGVEIGVHLLEVIVKIGMGGIGEMIAAREGGIIVIDWFWYLCSFSDHLVETRARGIM
jgi:hypothetical protein